MEKLEQQKKVDGIELKDEDTVTISVFRNELFLFMSPMKWKKFKKHYKVLETIMERYKQKSLRYIPPTDKIVVRNSAGGVIITGWEDLFQLKEISDKNWPDKSNRVLYRDIKNLIRLNSSLPQQTIVFPSGLQSIV